LSITKIDSALLGTSGASDGDVLTYVGANSSVEFKAVDASGSANLVEANLDAYASYANSTFATDTNLNTVQDNVATNATTITTNKSISDTFGTYANSTFATSSYVDSEIAGLVDSAPATLDTLNELAAALGDDANLSVTLTNAIGTVSANAATNSTNLDTLGAYANTTFATDTNLNVVQDNVATNASSITALDSELDTFGSYANSTFSSGVSQASVDLVQDNVATNATTITALDTELTTFASYANSTFGSGSGDANIVEANLDSFASYANSTFASGNIGNVQNNLDAYATYANANFLTSTAANVGNDNYAVDASTNTFTLAQSVSNVNNILLMMNGLIQSPDTYTVNDTTLTVSNVAPLPAGINVDVRYLQFVFPGTIDGGGV